MITIHGYSPSGNCHKLRMLLGHLGQFRAIDIRHVIGFREDFRAIVGVGIEST